jgi:hypothetical protein
MDKFIHKWSCTFERRARKEAVLSLRNKNCFLRITLARRRRQIDIVSAPRRDVSADNVITMHLTGESQAVGCVVHVDELAGCYEVIAGKAAFKDDDAIFWHELDVRFLAKQDRARACVASAGAGDQQSGVSQRSAGRTGSRLHRKGRENGQ